MRFDNGAPKKEFSFTSGNRARHKLSLSKQKSRQKRWSHQDELEALKGKRLRITTADGHFFFGTLVEADQFTIKVDRTDGLKPVVVFKSGLTSFQEA